MEGARIRRGSVSLAHNRHPVGSFCFHFEGNNAVCCSLPGRFLIGPDWHQQPAFFVAASLNAACRVLSALYGAFRMNCDAAHAFDAESTGMSTPMLLLNQPNHSAFFDAVDAALLRVLSPNPVSDYDLCYKLCLSHQSSKNYGANERLTQHAREKATFGPPCPSSATHRC